MQYNAIVNSIKDITPEIKLFSISFKDGHKFDFRAGQFAVLGLPDDKSNLDGEWHRRAYSITSAPSQSNVEFYIVLVKEGKLTPRLFALQPGDEVFMGEKAAGLMGFANVPEDNNILFVSTGTGIAPFVSMLREHKDEIFNGKLRVVLIHGARHTYELGFKGELEELAKKTPFFHYWPIVSRSEQEFGVEWKGYKGHAQSLITNGTVEKDFGTKIETDNFSVFLCGNPKMVDECVALFDAKGFTRNTIKEKGNLFFDKH